MIFMEWGAALFRIVGALLLALNCRYSRYGFVLFVASSVLWLGVSYQSQASGLFVQSVIFLGINILGLYRWCYLKNSDPS